MSLYITEAEVAESLTPADARDAVRRVVRAPRARHRREPVARARRAAGRRVRGDAVRRPRARLRRAQDVRWLPGGTPFLVVLFSIEPQRSHGDRRGGRCSDSCAPPRRPRSRRSCSRAAARRRSACSAAAARRPRTSSRCATRCRRSSASSSHGRDAGPARGVLRGARLRAGGGAGGGRRAATSSSPRRPEGPGAARRVAA